MHEESLAALRRLVWLTATTCLAVLVGSGALIFGLLPKVERALHSTGARHPARRSVRRRRAAGRPFSWG